MAKRFEFSIVHNLYAYSVESLVKLCEEYPLTASYRINDRSIEKWLYKIGETELYETAKKIRKEPNTAQVQTFINTFNHHLNNRKFFKKLNIDRAIEITLKEYDTLRAEILQNISEINQLLLLGLAAIFTIGSLGLAPLADFLTMEDTTIQMPLQLKNIGEIIKGNDGDITINNGDFKIYNKPEKKESGEMETSPIKLQEFFRKIDPSIKDKEIQKIINNNTTLSPFDINTARVIVRGTSNDPQYFLKITRATNNETIEKQGIVPSIIIFNWLIPGLCFYLIYRSLFAIQLDKMIGIYIYHRVEKRLIKLTKDQAKYEFNMTANQIQKSYLTQIGLENYIRRHPKYLEPLHITLILFLFCTIILASFIGGSILFFWDFVNSKYEFNGLCNEPGYWSLVAIPFILWLIFFLYCWVKGSYVKSLDKPTKPNKLNWFGHVFMICHVMLCSFWEFIRVCVIFRLLPNSKQLIYRNLKKKRKQFMDKISELYSTLDNQLILSNNLITELDSLVQELQQIPIPRSRKEFLKRLNALELNTFKKIINDMPTNRNIFDNISNRMVNQFSIYQLAYFRQELNNYKAEINYLKPFPKNLKKELNDINNKLQNIEPMQFNNVEFLSNKTDYILEVLYFFLPKLYDFILINEDYFRKQEFREVNKKIDQISKKIIILQRLNRWSNPHFRFKGIFEDVLDDMWKDNP